MLEVHMLTQATSGLQAMIQRTKSCTLQMTWPDSVTAVSDYGQVAAKECSRRRRPALL